MKLKGCFTLLITSLLVNYTASFPKPMSTELVMFSIQGVPSLLLYPLLGLMADMFISRYKVLTASLLLSIITPLTLVIIAFVNIYTNASYLYLGITIILAAGVIASIGGMGMYEANAIQFGMQQLMEASSEQLSMFIHWYYWFTTLGKLLSAYTLYPLLEYIRSEDCTTMSDYAFRYDIVSFIFGLLEVIATLIGFIMMIDCKRHFETHQVKLNPLKNIFRVLVYTYKHKVPVTRSAFTYWENSIPSRIDVGKEKYGGPFTNEQVEDVKIFFRLLMLLLSLFGFYLAWKGDSLLSLLVKNIGCPSFGLTFSLFFNPEHLQHLVVIIVIPVYTFCIRKYCARYIPNLLTRIGIGMVLCLIQESLYPIIGYIITPSTSSSNDPATYSIYDCFVVNIKKMDENGTCSSFLVPHALVVDDYQLYFPIVFQIIRGVSSLMVFMTVLEFICAQAPYSLKGLLIGIWYSMGSIQYLVVGILDEFVIDYSNINQWTIYHGIKGCGIFVSVVLYLIVCKLYKYRERDEVVNEQAIIEEQYERELLLGYDDDDEDDLSLSIHDQ